MKICCLTSALLAVLLLAASAQDGDPKLKKNLQQKLQDNTGVQRGFNNFSKESDEELLQMLKTARENRNNLSPEAGTASDSWHQFRKDLESELDRRGRAPDGSWKKSFENANANKSDINRQLKDQIRAREFEKAQTAVHEAPPETVTSVPERPGNANAGAKAPAEAAGSVERKVETAVAGEERAAGSGRSVFPETPIGEAEGLWSRAKRWGSGALEALWGAAKVEATAEGSTRTIDHAEKKDTIQDALNTIAGEKTALEQHLKTVGQAYELATAADPEKGFNTPEGRAEIERVKALLGPKEATDLERTMTRIRNLDDDKTAIEKGREALKDKWRAEGYSDIASSFGLGARTIDPNDLDSIPELKRYVPDLTKKEPTLSTAADLQPQTPAEEKLLSALRDPEKRKQFRDTFSDQEILDSFRAAGSLRDVIKPKVAEAKKEESSQLIPSPLFDENNEEASEAKDFAISDGTNGVSDTGRDDLPTPERTMITKTPERIMTAPNEAGSSVDDFKTPERTMNPAIVGAGAIVSGPAFETSNFARAQTREETQKPQKVEGDYAQAEKLENALRSAEKEWRRCQAEARRIAAQKRAAREQASQQRQIAEAQRRQAEAHQTWLAQKRAYEQWLAQQQSTAAYPRPPQRQQRPRQNVGHQGGGVIMDPPR